MSRDVPRRCETCGNWLRLCKDDCNELALAVNRPYNEVVPALNGWGVCAKAVGCGVHAGIDETYVGTLTPWDWEADDPDAADVSRGLPWCEWLDGDRL